MKPYLMFGDQTFDPHQALPGQADDLLKDLELEVLLDAMAAGDDFIYEVSQTALLTSLVDAEAIRFRQEILKDCINHRQMVKKIYWISQQAKVLKKRRWLGIFTHTPSGVLLAAVHLMLMFAELLKYLKQLAVESDGVFESEGFQRFFSMVKRELSDEYLAAMDEHLEQLRFKSGVWIRAKLGKGNEGADYNLLLPEKKMHRFFDNLLYRFKIKPVPNAFMVESQDYEGLRALADLKDRGINQVANALAQSAEHIDSFFVDLRTELAFYVGCLNLYDRLQFLGCPMTMPTVYKPEEKRHHFRDLWEVCLALTKDGPVVGNDLQADGKGLFIITGANQGGKSTFLRSIGLAQLMMGAGMFVAAEDFAANLCADVYTHFKRQEDETMQSGKLDEELKRMSRIVDWVAPHALILFNESFAATNEREGSEIAYQILSALLDRDIKLFFVTHMFELANTFQNQHTAEVFFLRAEREEDGTRTFKMIKGMPRETSYAEDVFDAVFSDGGW